MKNYKKSKLNGAGVIMAMIGILGITDQLDLSAEVMKWILFVSGCLVVILRTFYTTGSVTIKNEAGDR